MNNEKCECIPLSFCVSTHAYACVSCFGVSRRFLRILVFLSAYRGVDGLRFDSETTGQVKINFLVSSFTITEKIQAFLGEMTKQADVRSET